MQPAAIDGADFAFQDGNAVERLAPALIRQFEETEPFAQRVGGLGRGLETLAALAATLRRNGQAFCVRRWRPAIKVNLISALPVMSSARV